MGIGPGIFQADNVDFIEIDVEFDLSVPIIDSGKWRKDVGVEPTRHV